MREPRIRLTAYHVVFHAVLLKRVRELIWSFRLNLEYTVGGGRLLGLQ